MLVDKVPLDKCLHRVPRRVEFGRIGRGRE